MDSQCTRQLLCALRAQHGTTTLDARKGRLRDACNCGELGLGHLLQFSRDAYSVVSIGGGCGS